MSDILVSGLKPISKYTLLIQSTALESYVYFIIAVYKQPPWLGWSTEDTDSFEVNK